MLPQERTVLYFHSTPLTMWICAHIFPVQTNSKHLIYMALLNYVCVFFLLLFYFILRLSVGYIYYIYILFYRHWPHRDENSRTAPVCVGS